MTQHHWERVSEVSRHSAALPPRMKDSHDFFPNVPARFGGRKSPHGRRDPGGPMALRPSQLRATAMDGALMIPGAVTLRDRYRTLRLPVTIMAGAGDKVVFKEALNKSVSAKTS